MHGFQREWSVAVRQGHVDALRLLTEHDAEGFDSRMLNILASNNKSEALEYLINHRQGLNLIPVYNIVCSNGFIETLNMLEKYVDPKKTSGLINAAVSGRQKLFEYWLDKGVVLGSEVMDAAAEGGQLELVKWMHAKGINTTTNVMDNVAKNGHLDVLKWFHINRSETLSYNGFEYAVHENQRDVVEWIYDNFSEFNADESLLNAISEGSEDVARYLSDKVSDDTLNTASEMREYDTGNMDFIFGKK